MKIHTLDELPDHIDKNYIMLNSTDDIKKMAKILFNKFGITYFAHTISYHDGHATTLITNSDVVIHWLAEQYALPGSNPEGPRMLSGNYFVPYLDNIYPLPYRRALSEIFYVDNMLMIVENYPKRDEFFSFATEPDNRKILNCYFNNLDIFKRFIASYKIQADELIKLAIKQRTPVPLSTTSIDSDTYVLSENEKNSILSELTPKKIPLDNGVHLTAKEVSCLLLCSEGKSAKEVAKTMSISNRTVEMHLDNAKQKLGCHRKSQMLDAFLKIVERYHISRDLLKK